LGILWHCHKHRNPGEPPVHNFSHMQREARKPQQDKTIHENEVNDSQLSQDPSIVFNLFPRNENNRETISHYGSTLCWSGAFTNRNCKRTRRIDPVVSSTWSSVPIR